MLEMIDDKQVRRYINALKAPAKAFEYCHPTTTAELVSLLEELLERRAAEQQTCVHPFNRLGIDADGVMWCVECLTKPLVIPVPFGSPVNQS